MLNANKIEENYNEFKRRMSELFPTRKDALLEMYDDLGDRVWQAPASSYDYFHNAFVGGYVDHVLRVDDYAVLHYNMWKREYDDNNLQLNFTEEELRFAALHHDLGKLGLPGFDNEHFQPEPEKWWRDNRGRMYQKNPGTPKMDTADMTMYLFNHYGVRYSVNEMIGIKLTDGLFEEANASYLKGFSLETKLRNPLPYILHHADIMAFRFEFDRWAKATSKFNGAYTLDRTVVDAPDTTKKTDNKKKFNDALFDGLFDKK